MPPLFRFETVVHFRYSKGEISGVNGSRELRVWPKDLFASQKGGRLQRTAFLRIFQAVAEKAGLPVEKRRPHCLKHSLGCASCRHVHLSIVKQALANKNIASTARYAEPTDELTGKAVNAALIKHRKPQR